MRVVRRLVVPVVIIAALTGGYLYLRHRRAQAAEPPPPEIAVAERQDIVRVATATGTVRPKSIVEVKPKKGGTVVAIPVRVDQQVRKGDVLATLDTSGVTPTVRQARAALAQAEAQARQSAFEAAYQNASSGQDIEAAQAALDSALAREQVARAQLDQAKATVANDIEGARARLAAAEARLEQAKREDEAQAKLTESSIAQAQARVASQEQALKLLKAGPRKQEIESQRAAVAQARVAEANARKELERQKSLAAKGFVSKQSLDAAQTAFEQAKAAHIAAQKALEIAEEGSRPEEIGQAEAQLREARAALANAEAQQVQIALKRQALRSAEAEVREAKAAVATAEAGNETVKVRTNELHAAQAAVAEAKAKLAKARSAALQNRAKLAAAHAAAAAADKADAALQDARYILEVRAPISGVVISQPWEVGMLLPAGFSAVSSGVSITQNVPPIVIGDNTEMFVYADVDESDIAGVKEELPVLIEVDALPEDLFRGTVYRVIPQGVEEQSVVTFQVRVLVRGDTAKLKSGMTADIHVETARADNVVAVPNEALNRDEKGKYVLIPPETEEGQPTKRRVTTGLTDFTVTEIKTGLQPGEAVLLAAPSADEEGGPMGGPGASRRRMMFQMRGRTQGR